MATELHLHRMDARPTFAGGGIVNGMPLEARPRALMLLAADLEVLFCTRAAAEIVEARQGVRIDAGRFALTDADRHERLLEAVASLTQSPLSFDRLEPAILFLRPVRELGAMQIVVEACSPAGARGGSVLLVSLHRHTRARRISRGFFASAFHLTASEAEVVVQLFDGLSIPVVASRLGVSINTVKTHLKNVFMKCEVRSQGELIKLVALGPWLA